VIDFGQISKGYLVDKPSGVRGLISGHKVGLDLVCWAYIEKTPFPDWVDLDNPYMYTLKIHLNDGRVLSETYDSRKTNMSSNYGILKQRASKALFGFNQRYADEWEDDWKKFVSDAARKKKINLAEASAKAPQTPTENFQRHAIGMTDVKDYFQVLGVSRNVTVPELNARFRELARMYHPDKNKTPDAEVKFKEISEAYAAVMESAKLWVRE